MARVPDFITKNRVGYKAPIERRKYKYTPPIPDLAIRFEDPVGKFPDSKQAEDFQYVLAAETSQFLMSDGIQNYYLQPNGF